VIRRRSVTLGRTAARDHEHAHDEPAHRSEQHDTDLLGHVSS
jgi:hypothetical protein